MIIFKQLMDLYNRQSPNQIRADPAAAFRIFNALQNIGDPVNQNRFPDNAAATPNFSARRLP
ncbi:hypothetical protein C5750_14665 [Phyllobacterium myrsinacearum]|uniref:Uncharacterized protein n=1 Tax=Phyllobacterium myrsinacearum TaxID=28101 RepID=A0A2S9JH10_9HYPH|nr:hypothetical protein C5750_14665 [Phyllobacterium myrsinacearum]